MTDFSPTIGRDDPRRTKGWFSRRHKTSEALERYREVKEADQLAKQQEAKERTMAALNRKPSEQLRRLDERLGKGKGAKKERARLQALIEAGNDTPRGGAVKGKKRKRRKVKAKKAGV